ncbi:MAG: signal recognition particle protein [Armatimonadetes bacterium]|nr:signal recognition particle protein [Armatimonadota bacterium]
MFEGLTSKLQNTFSKLKNKGVVTAVDVEAALRDLRLTLLEADVNFRVVREFVDHIRQKSVGEDVLKGLNPTQQIIKIVNDELIELLGGTEEKLIRFSQQPPTVIMLVGLQGTGKTTTAGKLAVWLTKERKKPLLVATDIYRPAAIEQLRQVGKSANLPVFDMGQRVAPADIAKAALSYARSNAFDTVVIDTAGRLHVDAEMMDEIRQIKEAVKPHETLLVVDAMTGQDAVNAATEFDKVVDLDGVILTKLDGDARGGAVLSIRQVIGKPIKFAGIGEKLEAFEPFFPDRMASRILGMGDVLSLIEKAEEAFTEEQALEMERKLRTNQFGFDDFLEQLQQIKKMGPLDQILSMIPGLNVGKNVKLEVDEKGMAHTEAIIYSMTPVERRNPDLLNGSRRRRIALGSGTTVQEVNQLLNQFRQMKKMMKQLGGGKRMPKGFQIPIG